MNSGWAWKKLMDGYKVRRAVWGEDTAIKMIKTDKIITEEGVRKVRDRRLATSLILYCTGEPIDYYITKQSDLDAEDWQIYYGDKFGAKEAYERMLAGQFIEDNENNKIYFYAREEFCSVAGKTFHLTQGNLYAITEELDLQHVNRKLLKETNAYSMIELDDDEFMFLKKA